MEERQIRIYLLQSRVQITINGQSLPFTRKAAQKLFIYMADTNAADYTRDELSYFFYGSDLKARRRFSGEVLYYLPEEIKDLCIDQTDPDEIRFNSNQVWIDSHEFGERANVLLQNSPISRDEHLSEAKSLLDLYQDHFLSHYLSTFTENSDNQAFLLWVKRRRREVAELRHRIFDEVIRLLLERGSDGLTSWNEAQTYAAEWLRSIEPGPMPLQYLIWLSANRFQNDALQSYLMRLKNVENREQIIVGPSLSRWKSLIKNNDFIPLSELRLQDRRPVEGIVKLAMMNLIAREDVLKEILALLSATSGTRVFAVLGSAGVGKTQIARAITRALREKDRTRRIIELDLDTTLDLEMICNNVLHQLGVPDLAIMNYAVKRQRVKQLLQAPNLLVIVDEGHTEHLTNPQSLTTIVDILSGAQIMLVARQITGADYYRVEVKPFTREQVEDFLCQQIPHLRLLDKKLFSELTDLTGGLPLLLHIIAGFLKKERIRLPALLAKLKSFDIQSDVAKEHLSVTHRVLRLIWRFMQPEERYLLYATSLFAPMEGATLEDIVTICSTIFPQAIIRQKMSLLVDMKLLEPRSIEYEGGHYVLHPLMREFSREQIYLLDAHLPHLPTIERSYIQHITDVATYHKKEFNELDKLVENVLYVLDKVFFDDSYAWAHSLAIQALSQIAPYFERRGMYFAGFRLISRALEICETIAVDPTRVQLLHYAGRLAYKQGDYQLARNFYEKALVIATSLELEQVYSEIYHSLGLIHLQEADYENAKVNLEQANEWATLNEQESLLYSIRANLGVRAFRQGQFDVALNYYQDVLTSIEESIQNQPEEIQSIAQFTLTALGITFTEIGQHAMAQQYYQRSISLARVLNNPERLGYLYLNLGVTHYFLREYNASRDCFLQGYMLADRLQHLELLTQIIYNQGVLASARGHHKKALRLLNSALQRVEDGNLHRLKPIILIALGKAYLKRHWLLKAQRCFVEGLATSSISSKYAARALYGLGLRATIEFSITEEDIAVTYARIKRLMQKIGLSVINLPSVTVSGLHQAQDYYQHDFDDPPKLSRYKVVEALEMWLSENEG